ncbi:hypothetical protein J8J27_29025, partial [Mycobacterium tuberculosis]|nr:hypothetical protein [Mycobacterium tuberculosis]
PEGSLKASIRAERPDGLQQMLGRFVPNAGDDLRRLAGSFAPLAADLDIRADAASRTSTIDLVATAAESRYTASLKAIGSLERWQEAA